MSSLLPRNEFPPGLDRGEFVALTVAAFMEACDLFGAVMAGELPPDPDFPSVYQDGNTCKAESMDDTPFNRAWYAAGKLFDDPARRVSFYSRASKVMPIAFGKKYAKYANEEVGTLHIALLSTVAALQFSQRTTLKALRSSFDAEFRRRLVGSIVADPQRRH